MNATKRKKPRTNTFDYYRVFFIKKYFKNERMNQRMNDTKKSGDKKTFSQYLFEESFLFCDKESSYTENNSIIVVT